MANKEHISDKSAPVLSGFTELFLEKLQENIDRKNQNPDSRIIMKELKPVYTYEIGSMMHTLGDVARPLKSSARYLEAILRDQMNLLLIKASEVPGTKALTHTRLLTLLVNKREKMTRLLHYLFLKDSSELLGKRKYEEYANAVDNAQFGKRVKMCLEFLRNTGAGDYDPQAVKSGSDDIALERVARRFHMSRKMSNEEYLKFSQKQSICFYPKGDGGKFKNWVLADKVTTLHPTPIALDILSYFARETVAEIVEAALQIDQPKKHSNLDVPNILEKNNHQSSTDQEETFSYSESDAFNLGRLEFTNIFANGSDSSLNITSLINSKLLGIDDIFALSTSSLSKNDIFSPAEESPPTKKRKMETMDSDTKSNNGKSEIGEIESFRESRLRLDLQEPKILPRNRGNPITVEDLRSTVMNIIMLNEKKFQFSKEKRILCL